MLGVVGACSVMESVEPVVSFCRWSSVRPACGRLINPGRVIPRVCIQAASYGKNLKKILNSLEGAGIAALMQKMRRLPARWAADSVAQGFGSYTNAFSTAHSPTEVTVPDLPF